jgi:hypothetical protein
MTVPTPVNSEIIDKLTKVNIKVLGDPSALAPGELFEAVAQQLSEAAHNATGPEELPIIVAQESTVSETTPRNGGKD